MTLFVSFVPFCGPCSVVKFFLAQTVIRDKFRQLIEVDPAGTPVERPKEKSSWNI